MPTSISHRPHSNELVEQINDILLDKHRVFFKETGMWNAFMEEANRRAAYLHKKIPMQSLLMKSPFEQLFSRALKVPFQKNFSCLA